MYGATSRAPHSRIDCSSRRCSSERLKSIMESRKKTAYNAEAAEPAETNIPGELCEFCVDRRDQSGESYHARRATCTAAPRRNCSVAAALAPLDGSPRGSGLADS